MRSSKRGRNSILTWADARQILDTRFEQVRLNGLLRLTRPIGLAGGGETTTDDDFARALFLRIIQDQWGLAIRDLKGALLPQRKRRLYRAVRTVNRRVGRREKVLPRNSTKHKRLNPPRKKRARKVWKKPRWKSAHTSHHRGKYVSQGRRGRPAKADHQKKLTREHRNARRRQKWREQRIAKGLPVHRLNAPKRRKSLGLIAAARAFFTLENSFAAEKRDKRSNHDARYGYRRAERPERRRKGEKKSRHRHEGVGNADAGYLLLLRAVHSGMHRSAKLRDYWKKVKARARRLGGKRRR